MYSEKYAIDFTSRINNEYMNSIYNPGLGRKKNI